MDVYFFRHGFDSKIDKGRPIPGRYLFSVYGPSLKRDNDTYVRETPSSHRICVDGFEENGPGSNIDPNVFAEHLPWFLSFCRADAPVWDLADGDAPTGRSTFLAEWVSPGDVIVFGEPVWTHGIAIDTVLCVGEVVELPVRDSFELVAHFSLEEGFAAYWQDCVRKKLAAGSMTWNAFVSSADFVLNLADSLSAERAEEFLCHARETFHSRPAVKSPKQIVGTRCRLGSELNAKELVEMFKRGEGFDFIPIGTPPDFRHLPLAAQRSGIFIARFEKAKQLLWPGGLEQPSIFRLAKADGQRLLADVFTKAERLVYGPLRWSSPRRFFRIGNDKRPEYTALPMGWTV